MRKLVLLLVLMPFLAFGQQNIPLLKDGNIWRVARAAINHPPDPWWIIKQQYYLNGDTLINGINYKKLYSCDYSPSLYNLFYLGGMREDSLNRIYVYVDSNNFTFNPIIQPNTEYLVYDFGLNVGDTIRLFNMQDSILILQTVDSVFIGNRYRKRWQLVDEFNSPKKVWIDGIGDITGLFFPLEHCFEETQMLTCFEEYEGILWSNPGLQGIDCFSVGIEENIQEINKVSVNPNPTSGKLNIELAEIPKETVLVELYDISGRLIKLDEFFNQSNFSLELTDLQNGIYILNIKSTKEFNKSIKIIKN